jgi:cellulose biosynthesis protein BcsQ
MQRQSLGRRPMSFILLADPGLRPPTPFSAADEPARYEIRGRALRRRELIATAQALEEDGPRITALVRNRVEGSASYRRRVYRAIDDELGQLGLPVAATIIPARDAFEHAPLVALQPDDPGSQAFRRLAAELEAA